MTKKNALPVSTLALISLGSAVFYIGMEWLFFATKASFLDSFDWNSRLSALFMTTTALAVLTFVASLLLRLVQRHPRLSRYHLETYPAIFVTTSTLFLLVDNFIYSISPQLGVVRSGTTTRFAYIWLFGYLLVKVLRWIEPQLEKFSKNAGTQKKAKLAALSLVALTALTFGIQLLHNDWAKFSHHAAPVGARIKKPNIIFIASDGIEARALSVYGYRLHNTPFLEKLAKESLVFENAFTHGGKTTGSTVSMLNGISPFESKVGFPPQILSKNFAFRHLPAILKELGYVGFQRTVRHYADAGDSNMQSGFAFANGRKLFSPEPHSLTAKALYIFNIEYLFSLQLSERLFSRLLHITALKPIITHYLVVQENKGLGTKHDAEATDDTIHFITDHLNQKPSTPFFAHLHLEATHCCGYYGAPTTYTPEQVAEPGATSIHNQRQARKHSLIKNSDSEFARLYAFLKEKHVLENTIIVVTSDHSPNWDTVERLPLIIRFPNEAIKGRVKATTGFNDIPPTLLDYMGVKQPEWMLGKSRLKPQNQLVSRDWIDSFAEYEYTRFRIRQGGHLSAMTNPGPPLYGIKYTAGVFCNQWKKLELATGKVWGEPVAGHTQPCKSGEVPSDAEFLRHEVDLLTKAGFKLPLKLWKPPYVRK